MLMLPFEFIEILACPTCKGELILRDTGSALYCRHCDSKYPVVDGIPVLLPHQTIRRKAQ